MRNLIAVMNSLPTPASIMDFVRDDGATDDNDETEYVWWGCEMDTGKCSHFIMDVFVLVNIINNLLNNFLHFFISSSNRNINMGNISMSAFWILTIDVALN